MTLKDKILAANDTENKLIHIKEWEVDVEIKKFTGFQRDKFDTNIQKRSKGKTMDVMGMRVELLVQALLDPETKECIFNFADMKALNEKSSDVINNLFDQVTKFNGIGEDSVEEAEKN